MKETIVGFDICAVVIIIFLVFSLFLRKMTKGRSNFLFISLIIIIFFSGLFDIASYVFPKYAAPTELNRKILYIIDYFYFFARNMTTSFYILFIYSVYGMWHEFKNNTILILIWSIPISIIMGTILSDVFTHNIFYISADLSYYRGPWLYILYVCSVFIMSYSLFFIIKYRDMVDKSKFIILLSNYPISIFGLIIQFIFPQYPLEIFTSTFPLVLISLIVLRPEEIINYETGSLNFFACIDSFQKNFKLKRDMLSIFIKITNYKKIRNQIGNEKYRELLSIVNKELYQASADDEAEFFYLDKATFVLGTLRIDLEKIRNTAERINEILNTKHVINHIEIHFDTKICVVRCPQDLSDLTSVLNFANNFYKNISIANSVTYLEKEAKAKDFKIKTEIDEIIKRAISKEEFKIYFQPIYDVNKNKFSSAEALIRLFDEKYGYISPALFIPAAEKSGAIHQIGDYILEKSCEFIASTDFEKLGLEYIEINLSVAQCIEINFASKVIELMKKYRIHPDKINFEITETSREFNPELFDKNIEILAKNGISFSLDDYGTGYSNIHRVATLPLNIVKLDKCFVDDFYRDEVKKIAEITINMLKKIEKRVLVEGIETEQQLNNFISLGCDYIQGYYFTKALSEKDFILFLDEKNRKMVRRQ